MRKKISTPPLPPEPYKGRNLTFHHEGREDHEVKKFKSINFQNLRVSPRLIRPLADPCLVRFVVRSYWLSRARRYSPCSGFPDISASVAVGVTYSRSVITSMSADRFPAIACLNAGKNSSSRLTFKPNAP
jgi:hypothetical protein